jgi:hypothetical protein
MRTDFELAALADFLSVSMLLASLRFFLVYTINSPGSGHFNPSVKVSTDLLVFFAHQGAVGRIISWILDSNALHWLIQALLIASIGLVIF